MKYKSNMINTYGGQVFKLETRLNIMPSNLPLRYTGRRHVIRMAKGRYSNYLAVYWPKEIPKRHPKSEDIVCRKETNWDHMKSTWDRRDQINYRWNFYL